MSLIRPTDHLILNPATLAWATYCPATRQLAARFVDGDPGPRAFREDAAAIWESLTRHVAHGPGTPAAAVGMAGDLSRRVAALEARLAAMEAAHPWVPAEGDWVREAATGLRARVRGVVTTSDGNRRVRIRFARHRAERDLRELEPIGPPGPEEAAERNGAGAADPPEPDGSRDRRDIAGPGDGDATGAPGGRAAAIERRPAGEIGRWPGASVGRDRVRGSADRMAEARRGAPAGPVDDGAPPAPADPDAPRRFRWPKPDGTGEWHYGAYFPADRRHSTGAYHSPGMPRIPGMEWLDPAPASPDDGPLPPGWWRDGDWLHGPGGWLVWPSADRPDWYVLTGPDRPIEHRRYPSAAAAMDAARASDGPALPGPGPLPPGWTRYPRHVGHHPTGLVVVPVAGGWELRDEDLLIGAFPAEALALAAGRAEAEARMAADDEHGATVGEVS